ncbi:MAG TPA: two-component system response regulator CreB [Vicinamibacteria bacterium]
MKPQILLVEDERAVAETIVYALSTEGCQVRWVTTGAEAREALASGPVSLVVLDVGLPDVNGFDLCRELRARHPVPIVFLTARGEEMDRVVGLEIGADDYLAKPFSPRELSARVRAVLRRSAPAAEAPPAAPPTPFVVDAERRRVLYFGRALDLTRTEYELLCALVRRPGRVFSREQLMEQVWTDPGASTDRAIDSHVKALRAKLRAVRADVEAIETHRGQGYSLREEW